MPRRRPRLDLSLPDPCRQVAEFCAEFPQFDYDDILRTCKLIEGKLGELRTEQRERRTSPN